MSDNKQEAEDAGLARGRARRAGAGNRMRALLDGVFESEEAFREVDNDEEFQDKGDGDEDVYGSDFQSTDDEYEAADVGEKEIEAEAREARKAARRKAETLHSAKARNVATSMSVTKETDPKDAEATEKDDGNENAPPTKKRRYDMPLPVDAETGEVIEPGTRKSGRSATVQSKKQLHDKLKDEQSKRAALPKRPKTTQKTMTQDELIAEALETEEINIMDLNNFLTEEEETRLRNANLKRAVVEAPFIRWVSKVEKVKMRLVVEVEIPTPPNRSGGPGSTAPNKKVYTPSPLGATSTIPNPSAPKALLPLPPSTNPYSPHGGYSYTPASNPYFATSPNPASASAGANPSYSSSPVAVSSPSAAAPATTSPAPSSPVIADASPAPTSPADTPSSPTANGGPLVSQARNLVILDTPKASASDDMRSLFGNHVEWGSINVLAKNHPPGRKTTPCPITGLPARYLDPATGIPYANLQAYQTIQGLLKHRFVWSDAMGCYVGDEERTEGATGVPDGWDDAVKGQ